MIEIALKHFIYDRCIEIIFNQIIENFSLCKKQLTKVKIGDKFKYITGTVQDDPSIKIGTAYDCEVVSLIANGFILAGDGFSVEYVNGVSEYYENTYKNIKTRYDEILDYEKI